MVRLSVALTESDVARFKKYLHHDEATGCTLWTGWKKDTGYGGFGVMTPDGPQTWRAHRIAWLVAGREITEDKPFILHNCPSGDNPACCNVEHLWEGTQEDNLIDMSRKKRGSKGRLGLPPGVYVNTSAYCKMSYAAKFSYRDKGFYLGVYTTAEEAGTAVEAARELSTSLPHLFIASPTTAVVGATPTHSGSCVRRDTQASNDVLPLSS